jgi:hypothetical protein
MIEGELKAKETNLESVSIHNLLQFISEAKINSHNHSHYFSIQIIKITQICSKTTNMLTLTISENTCTSGLCVVGRSISVALDPIMQSGMPKDF